MVEKIVVSTTTKDAVTDSKIIANSVKELADITGQKPIITKAKKSIANFKLREGMNIGRKVTLRRDMMFNFHKAHELILSLMIGGTQFHYKCYYIFS